jgi:hypothetical protein
MALRSCSNRFAICAILTFPRKRASGARSARWGDWWSHQSFFDGTLIHQAVVVTLDGVFHNGSEGDGLIGALAKMLDLGNQFHRLFTEADAVLLWGIGMLVCHCC